MPQITLRIGQSTRAVNGDFTAALRNAIVAAVAFAGRRAESIYRKHRALDLRRTVRDRRIIARTLASLRVRVRVSGYNLTISEEVDYEIGERRELAIERAQRQTANDLTRIIQNRVAQNVRNL